MRCPCLAPA
uniref:Uncharacterized protein n=1 Tax=Arundo donax TaxID=35708 RepID=A0A0A9BE54_ARUDO